MKNEKEDKAKTLKELLRKYEFKIDYELCEGVELLHNSDHTFPALCSLDEDKNHGAFTYYLELVISKKKHERINSHILNLNGITKEEFESDIDKILKLVSDLELDVSDIIYGFNAKCVYDLLDDWVEEDEVPEFIIKNGRRYQLVD